MEEAKMVIIVAEMVMPYFLPNGRMEPDVLILLPGKWLYYRPTG